MNNKIILIFALLMANTFSFSQKLKDFAVFQTDDKMIFDICFTKTGTKLGIPDNTTIKVFLTDTQEKIAEFKDGHTDKILAIDISNDSTLLVSGGRDGSIVIWDFIKNSILQTLSQQESIVTTLSISPGSKFLVSGGANGKVLLYDIKNDILRFTYNDHKKDVLIVKFSPSGEYFATGGVDKLIRFYNVKDGNLIATLKGHKKWIRDLAFNYDGSQLLSCGDDSKIIIWNLRNLDDVTVEEKYNMGGKWLTSLDFNRANKSYVTAGINGEIKIKTIIGTYSCKLKKSINSIKFKNDNSNYLKVVVGTLGGGAILINAEDMKSVF